MADIGAELDSIARSLTKASRAGRRIFPGKGPRFSLPKSFELRSKDARKLLGALRTARDVGISAVIIAETLGIGKFARRKFRERRAVSSIQRARRLVEGRPARLGIKGRVQLFKQRRQQRRLDEVAQARSTLRRAGLLRKTSRRRRSTRRV